MFCICTRHIGREEERGERQIEGQMGEASFHVEKVIKSL